ncbi:methyl-accepting chemotaxis protein [Peredibacter sp. HCB2-198]|uniref:HAMP domain-containing methyl-accepting chemotaxis protein n=1 Tax=Peredibacter sp. HCB2-198 TaxID=3383025 RepID=UPI0038B52C42
MLREKSLKFKLLLSFGTLSLFVLVLTGLSLHSMQTINTQYGHIVNVTMGNLQSVATINALVNEANRLNLRVFMGMVQGDEATLMRNAGEYPQRSADLDKINAHYRSTPFAEGEEQLYEAVWNAWKAYDKQALEYLKLAKVGIQDPAAKEKATDILNNNMREARNQIETTVNALVAFQEKDAEMRSTSAIETYQTSFGLLVTIALCILAGSAVIGFLFSNYMNKTLSSIADRIRSSADQTSLASHELTSASSTLSQGATESAASLEETVSSLEELSSMVKLNSDHAKEANTLSKKSLDSAEHGEKEITSLLEAMSNMERSSKKIEEIINVIDDIAFQTNLLALNAAVEAARAGEQGKGFAVVADAVRNLAGRSASAAKDINNLIKENVEMTESGVRIASTSGATLKVIVESAKKVSDLNAEISAASQEQANGIEQISKAMNHLDQAIQGNASSSEEVASSASEMSSQSDCLIGMVKELKTFVEGGKSDSVPAPASKTQKHKMPQPSANKGVGVKKPSNVIPFNTDSDHGNDSIGKAEGF